MFHLKDRPKIWDSLRLWPGQVRDVTFRGMRMPDGSPVTVDTIMRTHGVARARAEEIARRQTR